MHNSFLFFLLVQQHMAYARKCVTQKEGPKGSSSLLFFSEFREESSFVRERKGQWPRTSNTQGQLRVRTTKNSTGYFFTFSHPPWTVTSQYNRYRSISWPSMVGIAWNGDLKRNVKFNFFGKKKNENHANSAKKFNREKKSINSSEEGKKV